MVGLIGAQGEQFAGEGDFCINHDFRGHDTIEFIPAFKRVSSCVVTQAPVKKRVDWVLDLERRQR